MMKAKFDQVFAGCLIHAQSVSSQNAVGEILRELQGQYSGICLITPVQYS
jgi:hypothetical protein